MLVLSLLQLKTSIVLRHTNIGLNDLEIATMILRFNLLNLSCYRLGSNWLRAVCPFLRSDIFCHFLILLLFNTIRQEGHSSWNWYCFEPMFIHSFSTLSWYSLHCWLPSIDSQILRWGRGVDRYLAAEVDQIIQIAKLAISQFELISNETFR